MLLLLELNSAFQVDAFSRDGYNFDTLSTVKLFPKKEVLVWKDMKFKEPPKKNLGKKGNSRTKRNSDSYCNSKTEVINKTLLDREVRSM